MTEIYRKIGFDASQAIQELNALSEAVNSAGAVLDTFSRSRSFNFGGSGEFKRASDLMVQFSDGSKQAIGSLDDLVSSAQRAQSGMKPLGEELKRSEERAKRGAGAFTRFTKSVLNILTVRAVIGTLGAISSAFRQSAEAAKEFQLAIAEIQTIAGPLNQTNQQITDGVLRISAALGSDAVETARGLYQVLSNQVVDAAQSFQFLEQAQKLAITTVATTGEAVDALSSVMNAYSLDAGAAARVSDTLFEAVNVGRFTLDEIANIIGRVTPLTAEMGITWEETAAAIATMTQSGVRADTAITQLRAITTKLLKPTEALQEVYRKWGVEDGPAAIRTFGGLQGVIKKITQETGGSNAELAKFFNEVRGLAGVLGLNVDNGERFAETLAQIENSAGRAQEAFEGFQATPVQQLVIETEKFNAALIQLGTALIPVRTALAGVGQEFVTNLAKGLDVILNISNRAGLINSAIDQGLEQAFKDIADARKDFTALDQAEYKKQTTAARQAAAEINKEWSRIFQRASGFAQGATNVFKDYFKNIGDLYKDELKNVDKFLSDLNKRVQDAKNEVKDDEQAIDDLKFEQDLQKYGDAATQQKKILERAYEEYWNARDKISKQNLTEEEKNEARSGFKRAQELFKRAEGVGAFEGFNRDAAQGQIDALEGARDASEKFAKSQLELKDAAEGVRERLGKSYGEVKELIEEGTKKAQELNDAVLKGDKQAEQELTKDLQGIQNRLKDLKITAQDANILKQLSDDSNADELNKAINKGLDEATYDWAKAIVALQTQLKTARIEFDAKANITGLTGQGDNQFRSNAEALGVNIGDTESSTGKVDQVLAAAEEQIKKTDTAVQNYEDSQERANAAIKAFGIRAKASEVAAGDFLHNALNPLQKAFVETVADLGPASAVENIANNVLKANPAIKAGVQEINSLRNEMGRLAEQLSPDRLLTSEEAQSIQDRIKQAVDTKAISEEAGRTLTNQFNTLKTISDEQANVKAAQTELTNDAGKTQAAFETVSPFKPLDDDLLQLRSKWQEFSSQAPGQIQPITNGMINTKDEANNAAAAGASIGPQTATSITGIGQTTAAMTSLKNEAIAAAQAVAAAQSGAGVTAARGRYFAAGGLGALRPLGTDTIPAMIQRGEFVTNAKSSRKFFSELNAINQDRAPVRRNEGGSVTQVGDIHVAVQGGDTSRQTVRAIAVELNRELKRGTIRLGSLRKA